MKIKWGMSAAAVLTGLMLAVQFQTVKDPKIQDTRDSWELRADILAEKDRQSKILRELEELEAQSAGYENDKSRSKEKALQQTLSELKKETGLTDVTGPGVYLTIEPLPEAEMLGGTAYAVSPELLKRLINELNMYNAEHISINGHRIIGTSVIREINGEPKLDGFSLKDYPIKVRVISEDAVNLYDRIKVSKVLEQFFVDNLQVTVSRPVKRLLVPKYQQDLNIRYLEPGDSGKR
ncbi:DUF881 domain-containing protein [Peribacillus sp. SCS-37]|uniref:DUF881 domain-containing protein n=1 Tax=Paraperibacillus esterisolvens TaxID=3115296 RepID=UPI0039063D29